MSLRTPHCRSIVLLILLTGLAGCVSIPQPHPGGSDPRAVQILQQASAAHGSEALRQLHNVNVRFEGKWNWLIERVQPKLVDSQFRGTSEERFLIREPAEGQCHTGPGGNKQVYRDTSTVRVWYNGQESTDSEVRDAAALVADNYRMFLLGPSFFQERSAIVQYLGTEYVDQNKCDNLLADLKPGIGNSTEDRVVMSIDCQHHWIRRVRITVDGLDTTRGAVADIYLRDHLRIGGILWPTTFYEELKRPFLTPVHRWRLVAIDYDRRLERSLLNGSQFTGAAAIPAGSSSDSNR